MNFYLIVFLSESRSEHDDALEAVAMDTEKDKEDLEKVHRTEVLDLTEKLSSKHGEEVEKIQQEYQERMEKQQAEHEVCRKDTLYGHMILNVEMFFISWSLIKVQPF